MNMPNTAKHKAESLDNIIRKEKPYGFIEFIHHADGQPHTYYSVVNDLNGERLSAFDNNPPTIGLSVADCKKVFKDIGKKSVVIDYIGTEHFKK